MNELLDEVYLKWLYRKVLSPKSQNASRTYWNLLNHLYRRKFIWFIPNDDNRAEDGRDLRLEFFRHKQVEKDHIWYELECSVLEMLVALSVRLSFEADDTIAKWFWELIDNLGLTKFNDLVYGDINSYEAKEIDVAVDRLNNRTYRFDGFGGLFPLENPHEDQRKVEIWYQLSHYLAEQDI